MTDSIRLLSVDEVAAKLKAHPKWVYRNQELPRIKIGGKVWWSEDAIDAYLRMRTGVKAAPRKRVMRRKLTAVENR